MRAAEGANTPRRAMLLAAGFGRRMRPLTATAPKPLIEVHGRALIDHALDRLAEAWDAARMDALLLLAPTATSVGYDGVGDFVMSPEGRLRRRAERELAPFVYAGVAILHPRLFAGSPEGAFSLNLLFDRAIEQERLWGLRLDGLWMHVGTPAAVKEAEATILESAA